MASVGIITGATGGMGAAVARRLAGAHRLILADIDRERLATLVADLPGEHRIVVGDITQPDTLSALLAEVDGQTLGPVVHAAGLSPTMADAGRILNVNLAGTAQTGGCSGELCRS